jgi:hypothetical protein
VISTGGFGRSHHFLIVVDGPRRKTHAAEQGSSEGLGSAKQAV